MKYLNNAFFFLQHSWLLLLIVCTTVSCGAGGEGSATAFDSLTEDQKRLPEFALKGLTVVEGLEVTMMAAEPMLKNPTNIDVDERGRVWVTEAYNYRPWPGRLLTPAGDRIIILEDVDGDGVMDTTKVFYQGPEINAPLGICVLGNEVIVSQSPYVWRFFDDDGDDKADRKEIMFQGIGGEQHDHGMHSFTFGPDGKLYFNFGNEGITLKDKDGKVVLDQDGDEIGPDKYRQGMVFRCNPDGSQVECLGHNFRNNFEVAVDSYGTMWQSDNDDDGRKATRINYVMEYGNYGFTDEMTGAGWPAYRTNMEDSVPYRHWHLNDPGVVPNLLQTGAGSPTGMAIYEGALLPEVFRNQMVHCEPGHNVVRSYIVEDAGAGYSAGIKNILNGEKDQWFRPADVCVAPDGSLIVADWYDAIVGGHDAEDQEKGRIYRIAPKGKKYVIPKFDYASAAGAVQALQNPNLAIRRKAWISLLDMGEQAIPELEKLWHSAGNPRMRARALWLLSKMKGGDKYIEEALNDKIPELRITALRAARQLNSIDLKAVAKLVNDKDPQVRRECAIALRHNPASEAAELWAQLAVQYSDSDRWYLEALGIGADKQWDRFFEAYLQKVPEPIRTAEGKDIIWRARTDKALPLLARLAVDETTGWRERQRYFRAFDFHPDAKKTDILLALIAGNTKNDIQLNTLLLHHLSPAAVKRSAAAQKALRSVVVSVYGTDTYIDLVKRYGVKTEKQKLLDLALNRSQERIAGEAVKIVLAYGGENDFRKILAVGGDTAKMVNLLNALGDVGYEQTLGLIGEVLLSESYPANVRKAAALSLGRTYGGEYRVLDIVKSKKLPPEFVDPLMLGMERGPRKTMYQKVKDLLTDSASANKPVFDKDAVLAMKGDLVNGRKVFFEYCSVCHQANGLGVDFGPKLTEIGSKLPMEGLLEAIVNPSGGISFGYESWELKLKNGSVLMGIIASRTNDEILLKYPGGNGETIKLSDIETMEMSRDSFMPALQDAMTAQQMADLLAYLSSLTKS
ncbi:MAG: c-type cytochrome [Chitinophagaceae bacterium]|nr:c-type cytochrome [Chitinophagaceae bacterium]MCW5926761.1 c-type cytochrome [Chitinophagaceae bacterium]